MSDDEIDLDRVITDPTYRRQVIDLLNERESGRGADNVVELGSAPGAGARTRSAKPTGFPQG